MKKDAADSVLLDCGDIEMHVTNILENHKRIEHAVSLLTERYEKKRYRLSLEATILLAFLALADLQREEGGLALFNLMRIMIYEI
ncbi:hypothetical protein GCM10020331_049880 [Ectobacillus funiculus]